MGDLLNDLRKLDPESYQGYDRAILKYALSLAEIMANDRQTRMTFEEFTQLPGGLEYDHGFAEPKRWSFYGGLNERLGALLREQIAARLRTFIGERGGGVRMEGDAILVQGEANSGLLVILIGGGRERVKEHLARGAHVWSLSVATNTAYIYSHAKEQFLTPEDSLEDSTLLPGFKLPLSEVFSGTGG